MAKKSFLQYIYHNITSKGWITNHDERRIQMKHPKMTEKWFSSARKISNKNGNFTLIELLVVVSIIAILAGLFLPALKLARDKGMAISCVSNQKQLGMATLLYADNNKGRIMAYTMAYNGGSANIYWMDLIYSQITNKAATPNIWLNYEYDKPTKPKLGALACPAETEPFVFSTAGTQHFGINGIIQSKDKNSYITLLKEPSKRMLFADMKGKAGWQASIYPNYGSWANNVHAHFLRHPGSTANITFADGHVSTTKETSDFSNAKYFWFEN